MNHHFVTSFGLSVYLLLICLAQIAQAQNDENNIVDKFIANQAKLEKAEEYKDARKVLHGDLNRDGKEDLVVLYTLEGFDGSNLYLQYLAIFIDRNNKLMYAAHQRVGGKNQRGVSLKSVVRGQINFDILEYRRQDASCCPSKTGYASFVFSNGKLKEMKRRGTIRKI